MSNKYITQGIRQDVENDQNICLTLRARINDAIHEAQKLQDARALAFYEDTLPQFIDALDGIMNNIIKPHEEKLTEGEDYHANERDVAAKV